jgi:hypothetical protein
VSFAELVCLTAVLGLIVCLLICCTGPMAIKEPSMPLPFTAHDARWQTLVHGSPVHVSLSCTLPRTELPLLLALLQDWSQGLVLADAPPLVTLHDPDQTIALGTLQTALGPAMRAALAAGGS